jgi:predicted Zn-dependent protease
MTIYSKDKAKSIMERALGYSSADSCEMNLNGTDRGNIRYARNTVSTSGSQSDVTLTIQSNYGKKSGIVSLNVFDDKSLEEAVKRSEELAKLAPENPEFVEPLESQGDYKESKMYFDSTANIDPNYRAELANTSINLAKKANVVSAGYFNDAKQFNALLNSKGLYAYNQNTDLSFTATMRTDDGTGSGWVQRDFNDSDLFNGSDASEIAIEKSVKSRKPKAIEPGKYTVILEPNATWGLLNRLVYNLGARRADEGRSFLSKKDGSTKLNEKLFDERVHIYSDPFNQLVPGSTWSGDGLKLEKTEWIDNGIVKNLAYDRYWAKKNNKEPLPLAGSFVMDGTEISLEELIKNTKKGILVTNLWYIRSVDPQSLLHTGLTRDGTFYIEDGEIKFPIKNLRFNESPIIMLNNIEEIGEQTRVNGNLIPTLKVRDFNFTSLSDAI